VDHRSALATFRTLARRTGTTAGRTALGVVREVSTRIAERGSTRSSSPPGAVTRDRAVAPTGPVSPAPKTRRTTASPLDVARAVGRNAAGLPRTNPTPQRRQAIRRSAPGAKLPARAGHGIVGV
jgi:hypothetical protein